MDERTQRQTASIIGGMFLAGLLKLQDDPVPAEKYARTFGDRLALRDMPTELLVRIERLCDLNPVGAADIITLFVDVWEAAKEDGRDEAITEIAEGRSR